MERTGVGAEKNRLQINTAALVDLKAALFRKQQEYKKEKSSSLHVESSPASSTVAVAQTAVEKAGRKVSDKVSVRRPETSSVWLSAGKRSKKRGGGSGQGVNGRDSQGEKKTAKDSSHELTQHEEEQLAKSRRALEAKAAIYARLSSSGGGGVREEEDEGEGEEPQYMVDFTRKIWEEHMNSQSPPLSPTSSREKGSSEISNKPGTIGDQSDEREATPPPQTADEEWVEYVDSFGRSRSCLRKDLPEFIKLDQQAEERKEERKRQRNRSPTPELLSEDMRRDRERRQWEVEAEEELEQDEPVGPVHYQKLREEEVRTHGAGYYAFSVDEEQRREQIGLLNKLREQTHTQREKREKLQAKRKALLEARLAKVRERKLKQKPEEGKPAGSTITQDIADFDFNTGQGSGSEKSKPDRNEDLNLLLAEAKEQAELEQERKAEEKRRAHVRPWDRGKVVDPIKKKKQELRDERFSEFAPPSIYSSSSSKSSSSELTSSAKRPRTDQDTQDSRHTTQGDLHVPSVSTSTIGTLGANQTANNVAPGPPYPFGSYFYPPGPYPPPPFFVPPPMGMFPPPPPPGGPPYFATPPPPGMSVASQQVSPPTTKSAPHN